MRRCFRTCVVLSALITALSASAGPRLLARDEPESKEIADAAGAFLGKLVDGDAAGAKALFAGDEAELQRHVDLLAAWSKLERTAAAKFENTDKLNSGNHAQIVRMKLNSISDQLFFVNGQEASVCGMSFLDPGMRLRRVAGQWRVMALTATRSDEARFTRYLGGMAKAVSTTEAAVAAGTIKTADEAVQRVTEAWKPLADDLVLPSRDTASKVWWKSPIKPDALHRAIGKEVGSAEVTELIDLLPGLPYAFATRESVSLVAEEAGLEFLVETKTWTVQLIFVRAPGVNGGDGYAGAVPFGLSMTNTRAEVERKLGRPASSMGGGDFWFLASYPRAGLSLTYATKSRRQADSPIRQLALRKADPKGEDAVRGPIGKPGARVAFRLVAAADAKVEGDALPDPLDPTGRTTMLVERPVILDERDVAEVDSRRDQEKRWTIAITFTAEGGRKLKGASEASIGRRLAIILDGNVLTAPTIRSAIAERIQIDMAAGTAPDEVFRIAGRMHAAVFSIPPADAAKE